MVSFPPSAINCLTASMRVSTFGLFRYCATAGMAFGPCLAAARTSLGVCAAAETAMNAARKAVVGRRMDVPIRLSREREPEERSRTLPDELHLHPVRNQPRVMPLA